MLWVLQSFGLGIQYTVPSLDTCYLLARQFSMLDLLSHVGKGRIFVDLNCIDDNKDPIHCQPLASKEIVNLSDTMIQLQSLNGHSSQKPPGTLTNFKNATLLFTLNKSLYSYLPCGLESRMSGLVKDLALHDPPRQDE